MNTYLIVREVDRQDEEPVATVHCKDEEWAEMLAEALAWKSGLAVERTTPPEKEAA